MTAHRWQALSEHRSLANTLPTSAKGRAGETVPATMPHRSPGPGSSLKEGAATLMTEGNV